MLQPRSERTRGFDLFERPSAFLEFAQTPTTLDGIKNLADRYGPLYPDDVRPVTDSGNKSRPEHIDAWSFTIRKLRRLIELWETSIATNDFSRIIRAVRKSPGNLLPDVPIPDVGVIEIRPAQPSNSLPDVPVKLLLKEDPLSASARLCIRPHNLIHALWAQLLLAIDGNLNLRSCVQCRKWFTLEAGRGRSDKEYCSDACRMRAYRKRKGTGHAGRKAAGTAQRKPRRLQPREPF
jgi:hypothetical protein